MAIKVAPATLQELATLITADHFGRPPKPRIVPVEAAKMRERAQELKVDQQAPKPMLQGRHLIARGMKPGSRMGEVLKAAFEAQINGEFADEQGAGKWLDAQLQPQPSTKHPNEIS
jgi:tRNA nucleotidyltransferase (CCA-adding enzyme)